MKWNHTWNMFSIIFPFGHITSPYEVHANSWSLWPHIYHHFEYNNERRTKLPMKNICGLVTCGIFRTHVKHTSKTHMCQRLCTKELVSKLLVNSVRWVSYQTHTSHQNRPSEKGIYSFLLRTHSESIAIHFRTRHVQVRNTRWSFILTC